ncbi:MAG: efflux RND transporter periplasmic adaptor subunit [Chloroflexi bacterium]|nr:efflux RND transporter periplasmic adaptor subunit [Chloroflexota bacterium]
MKSKKMWILLAVVIALVGAGFFFRDSLAALTGQRTAARSQAADQAESTVTIRPATDSAQVSAAGNIALTSQQAVVLQADGIITQVPVKPGDEVAAGDLLVALDTIDLERAVQQAELDLAAKQAELDKLVEPAAPAEVVAARASLASAQEKLAELQAGPRAAQLAAAEAALTAAQASYQDLMAGKSQAELTQLAADTHKAYITLQQAQEAYNKIAYRGDIGSTQQAMDLQTATIDYDTAKAAYEQATAPPTQADVQAALKAIKDAQSQLDSLQTTKADVAAAKADEANAEATLAGLLAGPTDADRRAAEVAVKQSQLSLDEANAKLAQAKLLAPTAGTVITVDVEVGQQATAGLSAMTMADLTALELTINVAEVDIPKIEIGQPTQITIDALPDRTFSGVVSRIAPSSASDSGVVNDPVTIRLHNLDLGGVRPGMTAVATIANKTGEAAAWLVPTNALHEFEGKTTVTVVHNEQRTQVEVTKGTSQGEWTEVRSPDLKASDQVVGKVSSFLDQQNNSGGGFRGPFGPPPGNNNR